jgi:hypothetical protein
MMMRRQSLSLANMASIRRRARSSGAAVVARAAPGEQQDRESSPAAAGSVELAAVGSAKKAGEPILDRQGTVRWTLRCVASTINRDGGPPPCQEACAPHVDPRDPQVRNLA